MGRQGRRMRDGPIPRLEVALFGLGLLLVSPAMAQCLDCPATLTPAPTATPSPTPTPNATPTPTPTTSLDAPVSGGGGPIPWTPPSPTPTPVPDCGGTSFASAQPLPSGNCTIRGASTYRYFAAPGGSGYVVAVEWVDKQIPGCTPAWGRQTCSWDSYGNYKCITPRTVCTKENADVNYILRPSGDRVSMIPDGTSSDYDLHLFSPDGSKIASSTNGPGIPDSVALRPATVSTPTPFDSPTPSASCADYSSCSSCARVLDCAWSVSRNACVPYDTAVGDTVYSPENCPSSRTSTPAPTGARRYVCEDGTVADSKDGCPVYQCSDGTEAGAPERCAKKAPTSSPGGGGSECYNVTVNDKTVTICGNETGATIRGLPASPGFDAVLGLVALAAGAIFVRRRSA